MFEHFYLEETTWDSLKVDSCLMRVCWMVSMVMLVDSLRAFRNSPVPANNSRLKKDTNKTKIAI
jgi:hypothetical protein